MVYNNNNKRKVAKLRITQMTSSSSLCLIILAAILTIVRQAQALRADLSTRLRTSRVTVTSLGAAKGNGGRKSKHLVQCSCQNCKARRGQQGGKSVEKSSFELRATSADVANVSIKPSPKVPTSAWKWPQGKFPPKCFL